MKTEGRNEDQQHRTLHSRASPRYHYGDYRLNPDGHQYLASNNKLEIRSLQNVENLHKNAQSKRSRGNLASLDDIPFSHEQIKSAEVRLEGCGYDIHAADDVKYGHIVSPNYPHTYPAGLDCTWYLYGFHRVDFHSSDISLRKGTESLCGEALLDSTRLLQSGADIVEISQGYAGIGMRPMHFQSLAILCSGGDLKPNREINGASADKDGEQVAYRIRFLVAPDKRGLNGQRGFVLTWFKINSYPGQTIPIRRLITVGPTRTRRKSRVHVIPRKQSKKANLFIIPQADGNFQLIMGAILTQRKTKCSKEGPDFGVMVMELASGYGRRETTLNTVIFCRKFRKSSIIRAKITGTVKKFGPVEIALNLTLTINRINLRYTLAEISETDKDCLEYDPTYTIPPHVVLSDTEETLSQRSSRSCSQVVFKDNEELGLFLTTQVKMDLEESPSCLYDYVQIGGTRMCGRALKMITVPYDRHLTEIAGGLFKNIALKRPTVEMTSLYQDDPSFGPDRAVDGFFFTDMNNLSCAVTSETDHSPWWSVDLWEDFLVWAVGLTIMKPTGVHTTSTTLRDGEFNVTVYKQGKENAAHTFDRRSTMHLLEGRTYQLNFKPPVRGRYVKVWKNSAVLGLCEVQVLINLKDNVVDIPEVDI
ncbi:uncharacterized protein [Littorina saxatilis]|uniref:uncharacterized protein n=1 Tax=Littorina saxatilis TaxID=31220 RepID=UPI0038B4BC2A